MKAFFTLLAAAAFAAPPAFRLASPRFRDGAAIPSTYACDGLSVPPPLRWSNPPAGTKSLALTMVEEDEGPSTRTLWVVYNIPPAIRATPPKNYQSRRWLDGTLVGRNAAGRTAYLGPCPGPRHEGRITLTLYALDAKVPERFGMDRAQLALAMKGHIIAKAQLSGTYRRHF